MSARARLAGPDDTCHCKVMDLRPATQIVPDGEPQSRRVGSLILATLAAACLVMEATAQGIEIRGDGIQTRTVTAMELGRMPRHRAEASAHGVKGLYEGVLLADLLRQSGITLGDSLRGEAMATYVLVEARDGYRVVFALPELDTTFTERTTLLADRVHGGPLSVKEGPFRVVVPGERRPARWIRQVPRITVSRVPP